MSKSALRRRITPSVPFTLHWEDADNSKQSISFRLSYDLNALTLVEEQLGKSMFTEVGEVLDNPSAKNASVLLWAAVQENHPEYAGEEGLHAIRSMLTVGSSKEAAVACSDAYLSQLPSDMVAKLKAIQAARAAGEQPVPLAPSPTAE